MTTVRRCTFTRPCLGIIVGFATIVGSEVTADSVLNPTTLTSPSGQYELFVDPGAMNGSGPATYRLTRAGEEVWSGDRPFSLWEAEVTDSGAVVGYAYEGGVTSDFQHGTRYSGLSVIILDVEGRTLLKDPASSHNARVNSYSWPRSNSSSVRGMLVDPEGDRFVVRIPRSGDADPVIWWTYRITTGEKIGDIVPDHPDSGEQGFQIDILAELVPGTSLTLVQWYIYGYADGKRTDGAALGLLDPDGKEIWRLDLPGEYDGLGEDWGWYWDMVEPGIEQTAVGSRSFSFRSYSLSSRLSFAVEADPEADSGWRVVETSRVEDHLTVGRDVVSRPDIELIELEQVGAIELRVPLGRRSPITDITDFAIDHAGNLGFVRSGKDGVAIFMLVGPNGQILSDHKLNLPNDSVMRPRVAPVRESRWVLLQDSTNDEVGTRAWWIDVDTGELESIEGFTSGGIESLVPTGDGGFITLARHHLEYTIQDEVNRYDSDGRPLWNRREPGYGHGFSFQAATWIEDVGVAALTSVSNTIEFFDAEGKHQRSVRVADVLEGEPNYPSGLTADLNGGLILHDFNGSPPIYRINAEGTVIARFHPKFPDGRLFRIYGDVQVAPDGTLWTSDLHSLLRLNKEGIVEKVLGPQPDDDALEEIRAMTVDPEGRIYVVNGRTAAVHVFGSDGAPLRICKPLPTDFATDSGIGSVTVDGDGNIYFQTGGSSGADRNRGYFGFSAQCERIGFEHLGIDSISEKWLFKPGSRERWVLGYEAIHLVDPQGHVTKTIERRPNRNWLQNVDDGAVAPDGSLAVIASPLGMGMRGPAVLCIYDADGGPIRAIPLTEESIFARVAFNGSTVVTVDQGAIYLYDVEGREPRKFVPPTEDGKERYWLPYMSPDGTEIWLRTSESMTLLRYKLP